MKRTALFEKTFEEVATRYRTTKQEIFETDAFEIVIEKIARELDIHPSILWGKDKDFIKWYESLKGIYE